MIKDVKEKAAGSGQGLSFIVPIWNCLEVQCHG
jgi:hypothetical protein